MSWDQFWAGWNSWVATLNWGDVPAWVGGVLTSGSLLLGFCILARDRRNARHAVADNFVTWPEYAVRPGWGGPYNAIIAIHGHNASDTPILDVKVYSGPRETGRWIIYFEIDGESVRAIPPRTTVTRKLTHDIVFDKAYVEFLDARNRRWYRSLGTNKYVSRRTAEGSFTRLGGGTFGKRESRRLEKMRKHPSASDF